MKKIDFNKIYNKNCLEGMKLIDINKIDLIITDTPFAIDKYGEQWVRSHYKNLGASFMHRRIDEFVKDKNFSKMKI